MSRLRAALGEHGQDYIKTKVEVVTRMEPDNAARALLAALRDDWQPSVKIRKERRRQPAATEQAQVLSPEEEAEIVRKVKEEAAALRAQLAA